MEVASDAGPIWLRADDGVMLPYLRNNGTWEPAEGKILRSLVTPDSVFVDVGANVGYFSRLIATTCQPARVLAFEPHPALVGILRLNVWGVPRPVEVYPLALGRGTGTVTITSAEHNIGDTRVAEHPTGIATRVAAMAAMDDLVTGRVDVVKIDVQGFETDVVGGMVRIIRDNPGIVIVSEFWPEAIRARGLAPRAVLDQYRAQGLDIRLLQNASVVETDIEGVMRFCASAGPTGQANLILAGPHAFSERA